MCVYIYIYIYIYVYMDMYAYIYIYIYIHTSIPCYPPDCAPAAGGPANLFASGTSTESYNT